MYLKERQNRYIYRNTDICTLIENYDNFEVFDDYRTSETVDLDKKSVQNISAHSI